MVEHSLKSGLILKKFDSNNAANEICKRKKPSMLPCWVLEISNGIFRRLLGYRIAQAFEQNQAQPR